MELRQLRFVLETARLGSFAAAAAESELQESGLHKQIRNLEAELDIRIFERSGRGLRITNEGHSLIERFQDVVDVANEVESLADTLRQGYTGVVTIGCYPVHVIRFLAAAIGGFERDFPGMRVRLGSHPGDQSVEGKRDLYDDLFKGRVDFTIGHLRPAGVRSFAAYTTRAVAVVADDHPMRKRHIMEIESLRDDRFVSLPRGLWLRNSFEEACISTGFTPRMELETTVESLIALAQQGYAVGVLSDDNLYGRPGLPYPTLVNGEGKELAATIWLNWKGTEPLSPAAAAFLAYVEQKSPF